ncbi:MAG: hypothetical protein OXC11_13435 [Rhodospirillales bacterium]|nr:hypothetical protein [Rhodospirillales bacterium]
MFTEGQIRAACERLPVEVTETLGPNGRVKRMAATCGIVDGANLSAVDLEERSFYESHLENVREHLVAGVRKQAADALVALLGDS